MKNLLVVDVQPAYDQYCRFVTKNVISTINKAVNPVIMWVGQGITEDTEYDVIAYFLDFGLDEEVLNRTTFIEKDYGFFRGWMDEGVDHSDIIKTVRKMRKTGIYDSRELELPDNLSEVCDSIYYPNLDHTAFEGSLWNVCGGGRNECLAEIMIWLDALKIKYKPIEHLIY